MPVDAVASLSDRLQEAIDTLGGGAPELVVDFSAVRRIDTNALQALEMLAAKANDRSVKVVLSGVDASVYKVLKLMRLASKFLFAN